MVTPKMIQCLKCSTELSPLAMSPFCHGCRMPPPLSIQVTNPCTDIIAMPSPTHAERMEWIKRRLNLMNMVSCLEDELMELDEQDSINASGEPCMFLLSQEEETRMAAQTDFFAKPTSPRKPAAKRSRDDTDNGLIEDEPVCKK